MARLRRDSIQRIGVLGGLFTGLLVPALIFPAPFGAGLCRASEVPFRVVLDPGHGGADLGTVFENGRTRIAEKTVTLLLAKEAARQLRARGFEVILTRITDTEIGLAKRTALANRLGADVFLSIHLNSTPQPSVTDAEGVETYILNNASDASSRRLAQLENSVVTTEPVSSPEEMDVALILKDLRLDGNVSESERLACAVQGQVVGAVARSSERSRNRGVKQALFHVLLGADMPSVLLEAGFLTSARDRAVVLSPQGRSRVGLAITNALVKYRSERRQHSKGLAALSRCKIH